MFDKSQFLNMAVTGSNATEFVPVPVGEYPMTVESVDVSTGTSDAGQNWARLDVIAVVQDEEVKKFMSRDKVTVRGGFMLDVVEQDGNATLDMGKGRNVRLGRLREAVGLNDEKQDFMFTMLVGQSCKGKVTHRMVNGAPMAEVSDYFPL